MRNTWPLHRILFSSDVLLTADGEVTTTNYSTYRDREPTERPVRLDKTEGFVIIEGRVYPAREVVEALAQSGYSQIRAVGDSLFLGRRRITPIFKSRQERAMAALCHGSLAFCCPLSKPCPDRDRALEVLGLTKQDYERLKNDAHIRFVNASHGIPSVDDGWSRDDIQSRTATRPAVDHGFGSDDYRRDFDELDRLMESRQRRLPPSQDPVQPRRMPVRSTASAVPERRDSGQRRVVESRRSLMDEMTRSVKDACSSCGCESGPVGDIASLFSHGEISPFKDDTPPRPSFCFACGRTIKPGTEICPYCGSIQ